ncbi:MAG: PEP-CTERM sorting domain-containing protein [Phenylobacterium sp.]|uniref:PEPxxWA-CTERM sorting domain-containing protein n=1 Tax=Phenylobacterium sp. TaxID=1871053 RepID=UPI001A1B4BCA|nr:PEPxxWA-CTERM sorting domain-containing protein [Phenylobacterium sp.]MBJ7411588.1 PEP-CTERM sorting domain-containing protein [Phenylobacterium sp.]
MHLKPLYALAGAAAIAMAAGSANAAVTFIGYQADLNTGETLVTDFDGGATLGDLVLGSDFSLTGTGVLFTGSTAKLSAAPALSPDSWDETQYLSIQKNQSVTLDTPLLSSISFYIGSLDRFNSFTFSLADGTSQVVTGAILAALPGMDANGSQTSFTTNGRLTFSFDSAITAVTMASGNYSLEIGDIGAIFAGAAVPEPATWAMMILGFGGVGTLMRRRRAMAFA